MTSLLIFINTRNYELHDYPSQQQQQTVMVTGYSILEVRYDSKYYVRTVVSCLLSVSLCFVLLLLVPSNIKTPTPTMSHMHEHGTQLR